jgi:hypothetical protein
MTKARKLSLTFQHLSSIFLEWLRKTMIIFIFACIQAKIRTLDLWPQSWFANPYASQSGVPISQRLPNFALLITSSCGLFKPHYLNDLLSFFISLPLTREFSAYVNFLSYTARCLFNKSFVSKPQGVYSICAIDRQSNVAVVQPDIKHR